MPLIQVLLHFWQTHGRRTSWSSVISGGASPHLAAERLAGYNALQNPTREQILFRICWLAAKNAGFHGPKFSTPRDPYTDFACRFSEFSARVLVVLVL
jgi:hypothetical protein